MKHTKGKWIAKNTHSIAAPISIESEGLEIARVLYFTVDSELQANAKLIAKAPEMLEALKRVIDDNHGYGYTQTDTLIKIDSLIKELK